MPRGIAAAGAAALLVLLSAGCRQKQATRPTVSRPSVVAADGALCDLTRRLAQGTLTVQCLLQSGDDPHQLQLSPQQGRDLSQASLVLINGYGLTPALERLPRPVKVAERTLGSKVPPDPHIWHDPRQAAAMVHQIRLALETLVPEAAPELRRREEAMAQALRDLDRWNRDQFATIPGPRRLATSHRALASLSRAYGLEEFPLVDEHSSSEVLRPQDLSQTLAGLNQRRPASLFSERQPPSKALQRISELSGIPIARKALRIDGASDNLMATLSENTCLISEALKGRCDRRGQGVLLQRWNAIPSSR